MFFNDHNSSYFLRQSYLSIPCYNTVTYGKHSLRYLGPRLWGKLSPDVRSAKNLNTFKNKIRKCDVDDGCKGCSLCSSELYNFIIFCINFLEIVIQSLNYQIRVSCY